jgi:maltose O-acetyltransferase
VAARLERALGIVRGEIVLRHCQHGPRIYVGGPLHVAGAGTVVLGERVQFWPGTMATELSCEKGGTLEIGSATSFNYGASIRATSHVRIGERCLFASMTSVRDTAGGYVSPVTIEDDVWVAYGACIEPGVRVGTGSVVAAGAVVRRDVPPYCLAIGRPAEARPLPRDARAARLEHGA